MAAFNFPNSPSTNDLHTENGVTFKWNGTIWLRVGNSYSDISTLNVSGISTFVGNAQFSTLSGSGALVYSTGSGVLDDSVNHTISGNTLQTVDIEAQGNITIADKIIHRSDTNTSIRFPAADTITAETAGSERIRITSAGNLGIGDASPTKPLTVGTATPVVLLDDQSSRTLEIRGPSTTHNATVLTTSNHDLLLGTNNTERLRIDSSGRILIGTTTEGAVQAGNVTVSGTGDVGVTLRSTNSGTNRIFFSDATSGAGEYAGYINYDHSSNLMLFGTNESTRVRIDSNGSFLIGGTSSSGATEKLRIENDSATSDVCQVTIISGNAERAILNFGDAQDHNIGRLTYDNTDNHMSLWTNNTERLRITSAGKLQIATPSSGNVINLGSSTVYPNAAINIIRYGTGYADMRLTSNYGVKVALAGASDNTDEFFIQQDNQKDAYIYNEAAKDIIFGTSNTQRFRINASGAFGLGGATYGSSGQVLTSAGSGSVPTWSTISGTTINSNADDRVITGSGTANTLTGEANLTYSSSFLLKNTTATSTNNTQLLRLENTHSDGKMTVLGFRTTGLGSPQTKIYGGNDNSGAGGQGGTSGAGKFKVTITNPSGMDQEVIYAENDASGSSKFVRLSTDGTERMRIKADGEIVMNAQAGVSYDTDSLFVNGPSSSGRPTVEFHGNGNNSPQANSCTLHIKQNCTSAPDTAAALKLTHSNPLAGNEGTIMSIYSNINNSTAQRAWNFLTTGRIIHNRPNNDGTLINFRHNNTDEGSISISGSSVAYNGGVLTRWSQLVGISTNIKSDRPTIYQGTVMSNLDEMCEWTGEDNQQLNKTKVSTASGDKDVAGVFWGWDDDDDTYTNDFYIAQTGDFIVRVGASVTVARGDLLESAGDGTAKPQSDDIVRSKTVAKIISTTVTATYADGSKAYPCLLMAS